VGGDDHGQIEALRNRRKRGHELLEPCRIIDIFFTVRARQEELTRRECALT
jgi:hypothetical protein